MARAKRCHTRYMATENTTKQSMAPQTCPKPHLQANMIIHKEIIRIMSRVQVKQVKTLRVNQGLLLLTTRNIIHNWNNKLVKLSLIRWQSRKKINKLINFSSLKVEEPILLMQPLQALQKRAQEPVNKLLPHQRAEPRATQAQQHQSIQLPPIQAVHQVQLQILQQKHQQVSPILSWQPSFQYQSYAALSSSSSFVVGPLRSQKKGLKSVQNSMMVIHLEPTRATWSYKVSPLTTHMFQIINTALIIRGSM